MDNSLGPNHYEDTIPEYVQAVCPSCQQALEVTTRGLTYVEWRGLPQICCPCCGGQSDRSAFGIIEAGNPGAWCYVEENTLLTGDLGLEAVVPQDDPNTPMVPYDGQDAPHGRDPEEGTSRPYSWETAAGTLVEGGPHPMVPFGGQVDPSVTAFGGERGPELFIPVSPIGVPPADDFGIVDDIGGDE